MAIDREQVLLNDKKVSKKATKAFSEARTHIILHKAKFFSHILMGLNIVFNKSFSTAGVCKNTMIINPNFFVEELDKEERIFLLYHETMHIALGHTTTPIGSKIHKILNWAQDYVINLEAKKQGYKLPKGVLYDERFEGMSSLEVYKILVKENNELDAPSDVVPAKKENSVDSAKIDDLVRQGDKASRDSRENNSGIPEELERKLLVPTQSKLAWDYILHNAIDTIAKKDYAMARPNRRFLNQGMYMPTLGSIGSVSSLCVAIDASGSVSNDEFDSYITEIVKMQDDLEIDDLNLICFDTTILRDKNFSFGQSVKNESFIGGGGTDIEPVFKLLEKRKPTVAVLFTDGEFYMEHLPILPNTEIIWLITDNPTFLPKQGRVIHIK